MGLKKPKALGVIYRPKIELTNFSGSRGEAEVKISCPDRRIIIKTSSYYLVKQLIELARNITEHHRNHVRFESRNYRELKQLTGYVSPDGED